MPGIKKADGPYKYSKVNQQKKYHLLNLVYKQNLPLREAAKTAGINYLTAKTVIFFHKNHHKSYQFDIQIPPRQQNGTKKTPTAFYTSLKKKNPAQEKHHFSKPRIEVFCSTGNVLNPLHNENESLQDQKHNIENMPSTIKNEQVFFTNKRCAYEAQGAIEKNLSAAVYVQVEPYLNSLNLNLNLKDKVEQAATQVLSRMMPIKSLFPSIQNLLPS